MLIGLNRTDEGVGLEHGGGAAAPRRCVIMAPVPARVAGLFDEGITIFEDRASCGTEADPTSGECWPAVLVQGPGSASDASDEPTAPWY